MSRQACALLCGMLVVVPVGCGEGSSEPDPLSIDDAFVVRIVRHLQVSSDLARTASRDAEDKRVRALARRALAVRQRLLPALEERLAELPSVEGLADLGVTPMQAAEEIGPQTLDATKPVDVAFLTVVRRHDTGALALTTAVIDRGRDPMVKDLAARLAVDINAELARLGMALEDVARRGGGR